MVVSIENAEHYADVHFLVISVPLPAGRPGEHPNFL